VDQSTTGIRVLASPEDIRQLLRAKVAAAVQELLEEEISLLLGSERYERTETRNGYRNGGERRRVTTETGPMELKIPRARVRQADGSTAEFRSAVLPRYQRRTKRVDEAILGAYLAGANTRRIRKALEPLLGESNLSRSAISRVVQRIKAAFETWSGRDLSEDRYGVLYLDGIHLKVRLARRVVSVPVLIALGVREDGRKELISMRLVGAESGSTWEGLIDDLRKRGMAAPAVIVSDGHAGLKRAMARWPEAKVQRCAFHKLSNLLDHCPKHARAELKRDYNAIVYARNGMAAREAHEKFLRKWRTLCAEVARSLEEAGDHLLAFYEFPKAMWKSLRTTNPIENLNREFRRRTKTQGSFSTEDSALTLLWGLIAFGQIRMRKIDGFEQTPMLLAAVKPKAA
jgi:transposase-like protein